MGYMALVKWNSNGPVNYVLPEHNSTELVLVLPEPHSIEPVDLNLVELADLNSVELNPT